MRRTIIAALLLATSTSFAIAQTSTANGNTGRVNSGTAVTASDTHNGKSSTDPQSTKRTGGQSAKNKSAASNNAPGSRGPTGSTGSATNGTSGTPDAKSTATVPGTNR